MRRERFPLLFGLHLLRPNLRTGDGVESISIGRKRSKRACTLKGVGRKGDHLPDPPTLDQVDDFIEGSIPLADSRRCNYFLGSTRIERVTWEIESLGANQDTLAEVEGEVLLSLQILTLIPLAMVSLQWQISIQFGVFWCTFFVPFYFLALRRVTPMFSLCGPFETSSIFIR
ncbi:hypothetical protein AMTRI_Chr11g98150 [Amborella trichopoda]